jgi:hypothetical protein
MLWPWVDREELTKANLKIATLEVELEHAKRVMAADATLIEGLEKDLKETKEREAKATPAPQVGEIGRKPMLRDVIALANADAMKRAMSGGPSIIEDLKKAEFAGRRDARG